MNPVEIIGALLALAYLLLATRENSLCWIVAILSSVLYMSVFFEARLYSQVALQLFFVALAVRGLLLWGKPTAKESPQVQIHFKPFRYHLSALVVVGLISVLLGLLLATFTDGDLPYFDAAITCFSIFTTFLVTEKVIENWIYWIVIDLLAGALYFSRELYPTAILFFIYAVLAVRGYIIWRGELIASEKS